jgi:hypothetical protein
VRAALVDNRTGTSPKSAGRGVKNDKSSFCQALRKNDSGRICENLRESARIGANWSESERFCEFRRESARFGAFRAVGPVIVRMAADSGGHGTGRLVRSSPAWPQTAAASRGKRWQAAARIGKSRQELGRIGNRAVSGSPAQPPGGRPSSNDLPDGAYQELAERLRVCSKTVPCRALAVMV